MVLDDILGKWIPTLLLEQVESEQHHCICLQAAWQALIDIWLGDTVTVGENIQIANLFYIW